VSTGLLAEFLSSSRERLRLLIVLLDVSGLYTQRVLAFGVRLRPLAADHVDRVIV
jgi:hypothetical protein